MLNSCYVTTIFIVVRAAKIDNDLLIPWSQILLKKPIITHEEQFIEMFIQFWVFRFNSMIVKLPLRLEEKVKSIRKFHKPKIAHICSYIREKFYEFLFGNPQGDDQSTNSACNG
jgi:hypothetical protein